MFKKLLSCLLSIALMLSVFGVMPMTVRAETVDRVNENDHQNPASLTQPEILPLSGPGGLTAYAWVAADNGSGLGMGPITVPIPTGSLQSLKNTDFWMSGADFVGDTWYAVNYDDSNSGLYTVDKDTGDYTLIGSTNQSLHGLAYDHINDVAYVVQISGDASNLYTIDLTTAQTTLVGPIGINYVIGIAADNLGNLYGISLETDGLLTIDKSTGAGTPVGATGIDLNFAQDIGFDRDNNILYGTLYGTASGLQGLYSIDTATGAATLVYSFAEEVDALAIPYQVELPPTVDNSSLKVIGITDNAATLIWDKATDDTTPQNQLTYQVYYSTDAMTDAASIESGTPFGSETADISSTVVDGLNDDTEYYFGVIVKDGAGKKSFMITQATTSPAFPWTNVGNAGFSADNANFTSLKVFNGIPYVAYMDSGNNNKATLMKYDANNGGWQPVGTAGFTAGYADLTSLFITPDGTPYVAFRDGSLNYRVSVMKYQEPGGWQLVGNPGFSGESANDITVIVDNGIPYVACRDNSTLNRATVKKYDSGTNTWLTLGNPAGFSVGCAASLSLAVLEGIPYVAYSDLAPPPNNCKVTVQSYDSSLNTWLPVGTSGLESAFSQYVALNSYSDSSVVSPVIAFAELNSGRITVKRFDSASNTWSSVGSPGFSVTDAYNIDIVSDDADFYLAYNGLYSARSATVMKWDGTRWVSLGKSNFSAGNTDDLALAYDSANDIPYVAYRDDANSAQATVMKFILDTVAPQVSSIVRQDPITESTKSKSVTFRATFNEDVSGVDASDFTLAVTGTANGTIASITSVDEATYDVTVNRISGTGTLKLILNDSNTEIEDAFGNLLTTGYSDGESYSVKPATSAGGAGGNGSYTPPAIIITSEQINDTTRTKTEIKTTSSSATVRATISSAIIKALLDKAKALEGTSPEDILELTVKTPADARKLELTIPQLELGKIVAATKSSLSITSPLISVTLDGKSLEAISGASSGGNVVISAGIIDNASLSEQEQANVAGRLVYEFSIKNGDQIVSNFGGGQATVRIPYTLGPDENPNAIVIYYLANDGSLKTVSGHFDAATNSVVFTTNHFSKFVVGYNPVSFADIPTGAWYKNAVDFIAARKITLGTKDNNYSPDMKLSRGQFIVLLMNAYQIDPNRKPQDGNFADAGNTYYTGYLAAAKGLGIANGIGNNLFAPDKDITRQEMFVLLYNALKGIDKLPAPISDKKLGSFEDSDQVASWANEALSSLVKAGIVTGNDNMLNPKALTSRAQMAQVLYNLLSK